MKRSLVVALGLALSAVAFAAEKNTSPSSPASDEAVILKIEQDWADALVKADVAAIEKFVAEDWIVTDPEGMIVTRAQETADLKSGTVKFESFHNDELKVRVVGDTAVVHGLETEKSSFRGKDSSGQYRFTDTFVKRNGQWQCVATHLSRVVAPAATAGDEAAIRKRE
jgi:ketosteroid isomerase-like protein